MAFLKRVGGPEDEYIPVKEPLLRFGRAPECEVILNDQTISRHHAQIRTTGGIHFLQDLNSRNRTYLNGTPLEPLGLAALRPNDRIRILNMEFVYLTDGPSRDETYLAVDGADAGDVVEGSQHSLDASRSDAVFAGARAQEKLVAVLDITRTLSQARDLDSMAPKVVDCLFRIFPQADRGFLALRDPSVPLSAERLVPKCFKQNRKNERPNRLPGMFPGMPGMPEEEEAPLRLSRTIVNDVLLNKQAKLLQITPSMSMSESLAGLKLEWVMCVPILTPDQRVLGIVQVDTSKAQPFTSEDLELLVVVASQAAIALDNAEMHSKQLKSAQIESQLRVASEVQRAFLPQRLPEVSGYEFFAEYEATYQIGGDFYDFIPLPDGRLGVALGDVSGKGVAAALIMSKYAGENRVLLVREGDAARAATELNARLLEAGLDDKFITLASTVLEPEARRLTCAVAGHYPVMVRRADGEVEEIGSRESGSAIGMFETDYESFTVELRPGDVVVLYSDGVTDAEDAKGEKFHTKTKPRLPELVKRLSGGPQAVGRGVMQEVRRFSAGQPQADDITLVCFGPV